jgi:3-dehydroquinate dehydratase
MKRKRTTIEYVDQEVQTQTLTEGGTKLLETTNKKNIILSVHEVKRCKFQKIQNSNF